jgi:hypothetical protein
VQNDSYRLPGTYHTFACRRGQDRAQQNLQPEAKVDGTIPQFNILQPLGSSRYSYSQPVANLTVDLGHKLAWNSGWNYYQYNEGSFVGPTASRYFHANSLTESLRYAF